MLMQEMMFDALRQPKIFEAPKSDNMEEPINEEAQGFYNMLVEANNVIV